MPPANPTATHYALANLYLSQNLSPGITVWDRHIERNTATMIASINSRRRQNCWNIVHHLRLQPFMSLEHLVRA